MAGFLGALAIGVIGSLIAWLLVWFAERHGVQLRLFSSSHRFGMVLRNAGMIRFHFSRADYPYRLPQYLTFAKHDLKIISISLKLTSTEGNLIDLFRERLTNQSDFEVCISLIKPGSTTSSVAAKSLGLSASQLNSEVRSMLEELLALQNDLNPQQAARLRILVHECMPMGSAIMLDSQHDYGEIQVETKLYREARTESFGYVIKPGGRFYQSNYRSWLRVIDDSTPVGQADLVPDEGITVDTKGIHVSNGALVESRRDL